MSQIHYDEKQITVKGTSLFLTIGIGGAFMACSGLFFFKDVLFYSEEYGTAELFGLAFMLVWTSVAIWMSLYSLTAFFKKLVIDENGISCKTPFQTKWYGWSEIRDFGLSYSGTTRGGGSIFDLYFAKTEQQTKKHDKKKLKRDVLKTFVTDADCHAILDTVIPFCERYTAVTPFIPHDRCHTV